MAAISFRKGEEQNSSEIKREEHSMGEDWRMHNVTHLGSDKCPLDLHTGAHYRAPRHWHGKKPIKSRR